MAASPQGLKETSMFLVGFIMVLPLRLALACAKYALGRFHLPVSKLGVFIKLFHNPIELGGLTGFAVSNTIAAALGDNKNVKAILSTITNWLMYYSSLITFYIFTYGGDLGDPNLYLWSIVAHYFLVGLNVTFSNGVESDGVTFFSAGVPLSSVFVAVYHKVFLYFADKYLLQDVDYWIIFGQAVANCVFMYITATCWHTLCAKCHFDGKNCKSAEQQQQSTNNCCKCCKKCASQTTTCRCCCCKADSTCPEGCTCSTGTKCCCCCCNSETCTCPCKTQCQSPCTCAGCADNCRCCCCRQASETTCQCASSGGSKCCCCSGTTCTSNEKCCKCCCNSGCGKCTLADGLGYSWTWSPFMLTVFSLGAFYCVYPGIAPFLLADPSTAYNIEIINLIVHAMPALIICILDQRKIGPGNKWEDKPGWNAVWIIEAYALFCVYTCYTILHYPDSFLGKLIIGNAALVGFMTVSFVTVQEGLKAVGLSAVGKQKNGEDIDNLSTITLAISLAILNFTNFLGDGYLQTYRKADKENWPTEGYTRYRGFKFWLNAAFKLAKKNLLNAFNVDVRGRTLM